MHSKVIEDTFQNTEQILNTEYFYTITIYQKCTSTKLFKYTYINL